MKRLLCALLIATLLMTGIPALAATPTDIYTPPAVSSSTDLMPEDEVPADDVPEAGDTADAPADSAPEAENAAPITSAAPAAGAWDELIATFFEENDIDPDTVALGYYNTVTGEEHYFRGDEQMTAASVSKVILNMYYAEKIYTGEISWDTTYGGLPYSEVQELSVQFSNNEYTAVLIDSVGTYPDYRRAICPYIGVDPDEKEFGFFTVNEFTAEQMMYSLKLLYSDPERYPGVIDNMHLAAEGEYFEQKVTEYEIAQKYGWYVVDNHNCINCVGIVEMEEPILLAIFTDNCRMGKNILGEYCALMCEYTENDIAVRREAEAQRLTEEEAARKAAEEEAARIAAEEEAERLKAEAEEVEKAEEESAATGSEEEEDMTIAENAIRVVACIIACAVLAIALGVVSRRKKRPSDSESPTGIVRNILSALLGIAAIAAVVFTLSTCAKGLEAKPVIMDEGSDPAAVAGEFMELALSGEGAEAEKLLLGKGKLGLDSEPADTIGSMLYTALQESFSYAPAGECSVDSVDASQTFTVTYLDIPSLTALQQDATNARLAEYLESAERAEEVQAEDGSWLPDVAVRALEEVTAELLVNAADHYVESSVTINLQYSGGEWKVIADETLFAILSGNTAY